MNMNYTINTCLVSSQEFKAFPNGNLTTKGIVNYFNNRNAGEHNPVKVSDITVFNDNGVVFFKRDENTSVEAIRAIAKGLIEIADNAEKAQARMEELNAVE